MMAPKLARVALWGAEICATASMPLSSVESASDSRSTVWSDTAAIGSANFAGIASSSHSAVSQVQRRSALARWARPSRCSHCGKFTPFTISHKPTDSSPMKAGISTAGNSASAHAGARIRVSVFTR